VHQVAISTGIASTQNLLMIRGAVPGPTGAVVLIRKKVTD